MFNRKFRFFIAAFLVIIMFLITFSPEYMTFEYVKRCIVWGNSDVNDVKRFPSREIRNTDHHFQFATLPENDAYVSIINKVSYKDKKELKKIENLDEFLKVNNTTAFLVIQNDTILYENYFNGYTRDSINTSFSVAKSFVSALIGIAIDEGYIQNVDEAITNYLPELLAKDGKFEEITIKHLLTMSSGIKYVEGRLVWGDDAKTYYSNDMRKLAINEVKIVGQPGETFLYNNYHPLLLGLILERATGVLPSEYLQEKIWKPLEMEYPASWSLDSKEKAFDKMESGINARAIDFAKFGRLFLHDGNWNGQQVISKDWVTESITPDLLRDEEYYHNAFFNYENIYYKYFWYSFPRDNGEFDFFAAGHLGQFIYVSPSKNVIIVRNGIDDGNVDSWMGLFYDIASEL